MCVCVCLHVYNRMHPCVTEPHSDSESVWWLILHISGCLWICIPGSPPREVDSWVQPPTSAL